MLNVIIPADYGGRKWRSAAEFVDIYRLILPYKFPNGTDSC